MTTLDIRPATDPGPVPSRYDVEAAERAARAFLTALGVPCDTESTERTPRRMAEAYAAMLTPRPFEVTTFPNDEAYDELVVVRSIPVQSVCEHHFAVGWSNVVCIRIENE